MSTKYQVFVTPLIANLNYGTEVDISDLVLESGIGSIARGIDSGDYDVGVYSFGDISLKVFNKDGLLSDQEDSRSMFPWTRNLAKVRVVFSSDDGDTITFRGLINEEATRMEASEDTISFRVLSQDSVLRTTIITSGQIPTGATVSEAIVAILNVPDITRVLNFDAADINPELDFVIDDASEFDNVSVKDALDDLLLASNSVFVISASNDMIVREREPDHDSPILNLYGPHDIFGRENIIDLYDYNTGRHRQFTSIKVGNVVRTNDAFVEDFGFRQKSVSLPFITTTATKQAVADQILDSFDAPKLELGARIPTSLAKDYEILDRVSINSPLRIKPYTGCFLPIIGVTKIGDTDQALPFTFGSFSLHPNTAFKIIEIEDDPESFETDLKLRQVGKDLNDGVFSAAGNCIVGFAIVSEAIVCAGEEDPSYNPSVIGAAVIGETEVA